MVPAAMVLALPLMVIVTVIVPFGRSVPLVADTDTQFTSVCPDVQSSS